MCKMKESVTVCGVQFTEVDLGTLVLERMGRGKSSQNPLPITTPKVL